MPQQHTSTDQVNFLSQWFATWSDMQREDFLPILVQAYQPKDHINGLLGGIDSIKLQGRRPSLFDCQIKLFHDWFGTWTEPERSHLLDQLREVDPGFMLQYEKQLQGEPSREVREDTSPPTECGEEGQNPPSSVSSPPSTLPRSHSPHDSGLDEPPSDSDHTEPHSLDSHQENEESGTMPPTNDLHTPTVKSSPLSVTTTSVPGEEKEKSDFVGKGCVVSDDASLTVESPNDIESERL